MEIQTLTFDLRGMTDRQAYHYTESLRLGMSEFDGLVRHARTRRTAAGEFIVFCTWEDERFVSAFRHSELYAKLALSPNVYNLRDYTECDFQADVSEDMIALARAA
jgi:hypothetical protein